MMFAIYIAMFAVLILSFWAQYKVKANFEKYSRVRSASGLTGAEAAHEMLHREGIDTVRIERGGGFLSDHYDPRSNTIRLSPAVFDSNSVAALGVACHEAGHAIQKAKKYAPLAIRNMAVPVASIGSNAGIILVFVGLMLGAATQAGSIGFPIAVLGLVLFAATVAFQLINLPVEFDATARAKHALVSHGMIQRGAEAQAVDKVLDAAALTYVASTISAVITLLYYAMIVFGGNRRN
jgi:Zn-dependent membrane protease YugP